MCEIHVLTREIHVVTCDFDYDERCGRYELLEVTNVTTKITPLHNVMYIKNVFCVISKIVETV